MTKKGKKKKLSGHVGQAQLETWQPTEKRETMKSRVSSKDRTNTSSPLNDQSTSGGLDSNCNGWDVNEMFRRNKEKFGVTSSYSPDLEGYTTPLLKRNTKEYREKEAEAARIAAEILRSPLSQTRSEAENRDEEDLFSFGKFPEKETKENGTPSYHSQYDNNFSPGKISSKIENQKVKSPSRSKTNNQYIEVVKSDSKGNTQNSKVDVKSPNSKKNGVSKHIMEEMNKATENNNGFSFVSDRKLSKKSERDNISLKKSIPNISKADTDKDNNIYRNGENKIWQNEMNNMLVISDMNWETAGEV